VRSDQCVAFGASMTGIHRWWEPAERRGSVTAAAMFCRVLTDAPRSPLVFAWIIDG